MGSKCKGIMGTVVLRTSCLLQNECVISQFVFTLKKACILFYSSYPYYTLVHDHIWISYFIFYFPLLECCLLRGSTGTHFYLLIRHRYLHQFKWNMYQSWRGTSPFFFLHLKSYSITRHTLKMLSDVLILFLITPELCKPLFFGLPFRKSHRKKLFIN